MFPFMFIRYKNKDLKEVDKFIVVIASCIDYTVADTRWMCDSELPDGLVLEPSIDLVAGPESHHYFDSQDDMVKFVANWYKENVK